MAVLLYWAATLAALSVPSVIALDLDVTNKDSIVSAAKAIAHDLTSTYYPENGTLLLGGNLPTPYNYSHIEAAMLWDSLLNYGYLTGDNQYNRRVGHSILNGVEDAFSLGGSWYKMDNDDQVAWALASLTAAEHELPTVSLGQPHWFTASVIVFGMQAQQWDTSHCNGGFRVNNDFFSGNDFNYKKPGSWFLLLAARLGAYTGNHSYFDWAEKQYSWAAGTPGLVAPDFGVYSGLSIETQGRCSAPDKAEYSFNQAAFLYGSAIVYNATLSDAWKKRVEGHLGRLSRFFVSETQNVNATQTSGGNILTEIECARATAPCTSEQRYYKSLTAKWISQAAVAAPFIADKIADFLKSSANMAAKSCTGKDPEKMCGTWWETGKYTADASTGFAEEVSALEIIQQNLNIRNMQLVNGNSSLSTSSTTQTASGTAPNPAASSSSTGSNGIGRTTPNGLTKIALFVIVYLLV